MRQLQRYEGWWTRVVWGWPQPQTHALQRTYRQRCLWVRLTAHVDPQRLL